MWRNFFVVLLLMVLAMPGWSLGRARGTDRIDWEVIGVEGLDYICFTTRSGGIDCHPAGADPCVLEPPGELIPQLGRGPGAWDPRAGIESQVVDVDGQVIGIDHRGYGQASEIEFERLKSRPD